MEITEVIRQWQAGRGIREITRSTGLARNTIRKYLLTAQSCGLARDGAVTNRVSTACPGAAEQGWSPPGSSAHQRGT
ncbi:hypothetical protein ACFLVN_03450 [Chloroflexota bacterium]